MPRFALVLMFLALLSTYNVNAQTATGQVNGTVADQSKAAVPSATVILLNRATSIEMRATTNTRGFYTFINVAPGNYMLRVEASGFRTAQLPEFKVDVNSTITNDVALSVGQVSEVVEVKAEAETLQQSSAELGTVVSRAAVQELPLNGRNFTQLLTLTPGATPISTSQGAVIGSTSLSSLALPGSGFSNPSIHGQINRSTIYFLDGVINTDFRGTTYSILPNVDLIQEFKVQSHNDKAEYGGVAGGIVNVVSTSGTNQLHGSGYEFVRNDFFDARNTFLDATKSSPSVYRQNQFGGTVSGPIIKNRTFFSGGYEGWRYSKAAGLQYRVPTDAELSGDFSSSIIRRNIYDPLTTRPDPNNSNQLIRDQFPGNQIPSTRISPMVLGFIQTFYDRPNFTDPVFNVLVNSPTVNKDDSWQIKVDHQINQNNSVYFRYSAMYFDQNTPSTLKQTTYARVNAQNFGGGVLHTFSPHLIADIRGGYGSRPFLNGTETTGGTFDTMAKLGFTGTDQFGGVTLGLAAPWGSAGIGQPNDQRDPSWNISPNLTLIHGNHNFKFGYQVMSLNRLTLSSGINYGFVDVTTSNPSQPGTTGASLASALLGLPQSYSGSAVKKTAFKFCCGTDFDIPLWGAYMQDEWRIRPNITLTYGLRFDHTNHAILNAGMNNGPNLLTGNWEIGGGALPPPCNQGGGAPCIPGNGLQDVPFGDHIVVAQDPVRDRQSRSKDWGPRLSVAWRATSKTVIRTGYAIFYDVMPALNQAYSNTLNSWPYSSGFSGNANAVGAAPTFIQSLQGSFPLPLPAASPWAISTNFSAPERQDPMSQQWNLEIQRMITEDVMMSVAYVGSTNRHAVVSGIANSALIAGPGSPAQVNARRPYPWMPSYTYDDTFGSTNYNAFEFKATRRMSHGLQALVSYTWSKALDYGSSGWFSVENGPGGSGTLQNYYDLKGSKGVSAFDITHILSISANWDLPVGQGKPLLNSGLMSRILGNWQTNMIAQFRSGQPFTIVVPGDVANIGNSRPTVNYARPNLAGDWRVSDPTSSRYFNTAAFQIPSFSYGNLGRTPFRSPHSSNVDFSLFKEIPVSGDGRRKIELRAEAFNIFNIQNWAPPADPSGVTVGNAGFGRITTLAGSPRTIQLGLRILF